MSPQPGSRQDGGVADALRAAIDRTLSVAARPPGATALPRERATQLLDEVAKLGREASGELARRGQGAGAELARRGQGAAEEVAQRLESVERRLAALEEALRGPRGKSKPKAEG